MTQIIRLHFEPVVLRSAFFYSLSRTSAKRGSRQQAATAIATTIGVADDDSGNINIGSNESESNLVYTGSEVGSSQGRVKNA